METEFHELSIEEKALLDRMMYLRGLIESQMVKDKPLMAMCNLLRAEGVLTALEHLYHSGVLVTYARSIYHSCRVIANPGGVKCL